MTIDLGQLAGFSKCVRKIGLTEIDSVAPLGFKNLQDLKHHHAAKRRRRHDTHFVLQIRRAKWLALFNFVVL